MNEPRFKFGDKVRIRTGFYRGVVGIVRSCTKPFRLFRKSEWKYDLAPLTQDLLCESLLESESVLELVEK